MKTEVTITGIADVNRILGQIAPREARNILRATLSDLAKEVASKAAENVPIDEGDLKVSIKGKRGRGKRNVLVASAGVYGTAWYWRFLEYGQGPDGVEHAFFLKALQAIRPDLDRMYLETFVAKLEARLAKLRKKAGG
jgi:HK97 gp10 family phage protein